MTSIELQCKSAFEASVKLKSVSTALKNKTLKRMSQYILEAADYILKENKKDIDNGKKAGLSRALLDRLTLTKDRVIDIAESLLIIQKLPDPIGEVMAGWTLQNGLRVSKVRVPLGVIGIIYEARPNVTVDAIGLSIKTGNSVVLRGSSSAYQSNLAIATILKKAISESGINPDVVQLLEDTSREGVSEFVRMKDYLSVIIPRGGAGLIQSVCEKATVPTIETGVGNCHIYVDKDANLNLALPIIINAKTQRPSVCNACETVLIHEKVAKHFLPPLVSELRSKMVEVRGCTQTRSYIPGIKVATSLDWETEYLDLILAIKVVHSADEAISHIKTYGTRHSEAIISENYSTISTFQQQVDAAAILVNTSTRFVDGGEFGFGAEMGISTQKLHARGPMGLPELTTYKYIVQGQGQVRS